MHYTTFIRCEQQWEDFDVWVGLEDHEPNMQALWDGWRQSRDYGIRLPPTLVHWLWTALGERYPGKQAFVEVGRAGGDLTVQRYGRLGG